MRSGSLGSGRAETVVFVVTVSRLPSRSTVIAARPPSLERTAVCICSQSRIVTPLNATIASPGRRPACLAGATGSSARHLRGGWSALASVTAMTHCEMPSMVVVAVGAPCPMKTTAKSRNAITRLVITPEPMMMMRFHQGSL